MMVRAGGSGKTWKATSLSPEIRQNSKQEKQASSLRGSMRRKFLVQSCKHNCYRKQRNKGHFLAVRVDFPMLRWGT